MGEGLVCLTDPGRQVSHVLTSMFLHGGWMHILGNMWFMWIFGNNVEDAMGHLRFVVFYLLTGAAAALTQVFLTPGLGGADGGRLGRDQRRDGRLRRAVPARAGLHARAPRIRTMTSMAWPAWMMLGYWLLLQFVSGLTTLGREGGGVAFWAHFGGFVAGVVLIKLFARPDYLAEHQSRRWQPRRLGFGSS